MNIKIIFFKYCLVTIPAFFFFSSIFSIGLAFQRSSGLLKKESVEFAWYEIPDTKLRDVAPPDNLC